MASDTRTVEFADGAAVTLVRFRTATYRLTLHLGGSDPPSGGLAVPAVAGNAISPSERPVLLGAFNGGFKSTAGAGGVQVDGNLVYAASMKVLPVDLADAMLAAGVSEAMEMDINPYWVEPMRRRSPVASCAPLFPASSAWPVSTCRGGHAISLR